MALIADIMLLVAALGAAFYCRILAIRLRRLGHTDKGLGGAISTLNVQVEEMKTALQAVSASAEERSNSLKNLTTKATAASRRLELLLASLHQAEEREASALAAKPVLKLSPDDQLVPTQSHADGSRLSPRIFSPSRLNPVPEFAK